MRTKHKKKIIYIGFAFSHHKNTQAGYHHLKEYLVYDKIIDAQWEVEFLDGNSLLKKIIRKIHNLIFGNGLPFTMIKCVLLALFSKNQIFHFIYPENTFKWLHLLKGKSNEIVCTFHQPKSYFEHNNYWIKVLPKLDKIILMTDKDISFFAKFVGEGNVKFIPHGVNTDFYRGDFTIGKSIDILLVGNWMRDFEFANFVFDGIYPLYPDVKICVVTNENNFQFFSKTRNLQLKTNISDDELIFLYQSSKCLFLPLIEYTANNAILEAAATGCKIVVASNNIDKSYFNDEMVVFLPLELNNVIDYFKIELSYTNNQNPNVITKDVIEKFSWNNIGEITKSYLIRN